MGKTSIKRISKINRMTLNFKLRVGKNEYLTEYKHFNPWISHTGSITWVPEIRIHTKCLIKVKYLHNKLLTNVNSSLSYFINL